MKSTFFLTKCSSNEVVCRSRIEWDFSDVLEADYPQLFAKAVKEKYKGAVPVNYHKPRGLLRHADDKMSTSWILE